MRPDTKKSTIEKHSNVKIMTPGEYLRRIIFENGFTVAQVAAGADVSVTTIYNIMNGVTNITNNTATKLGKFFGNGKAFWFKKQFHLDDMFLRVKHLSEYASEKCAYEKRTLKMMGNYLTIAKKSRFALLRTARIKSQFIKRTESHAIIGLILA